MEAAIKTIAPTRKIADQVLDHALAREGHFDNRGAGGPLRFEALLEILHEAADPTFAFLGFMSQERQPNELHHILAQSALQGATIVTTNFDDLIERALISLKATPATICTNNDFAHGAHESDRISVYKLHGSLLRHADGVASASITTIQTTIMDIVKGADEFLLADPKRSMLASLVRGATVVVVGYSGSDDFDIVPTFAGLEPAGLKWISHTPDSASTEDITAGEEERICATPMQDRTPREQMFYRFFTERPGVLQIVRANTLDYLAREFGRAAPKTTDRRGRRLRLETYLKHWRRLHLPSTANRYRVIAEIFYHTSRVKEANAFYRRAFSSAARDAEQPASYPHIILGVARTYTKLGNFRAATRWHAKVESLWGG